MLVKDLIAELNHFSPDETVCVFDGMGAARDIRIVRTLVETYAVPQGSVGLAPLITR
jgi:hypothetical protein